MAGRGRAALAVVAVVLIGAIAVLAWALTTPTADGRVVRVGMYENPPKIYTGDGGAPAGLFPSILDAIAEGEGWTIDYVDCDWADCLEMLQKGELDLMPDVAWSADRDETMDFGNETVAKSWSQVFVRPDIDVESLADLAGLRIALLSGGIQEQELSTLLQAEGVPYTPVALPTLADAYKAVEVGAADAVVTNRFFAAWNLQKFSLRETPIMFLPTALYFAVADARNLGLLDTIDRDLAALKADPDSVYYSALTAALVPPIDPELPSWAVPTLAALGLGLAIAGLLVVLLRWEVRRRARALADSELRYRTLETRDPLTGLPNRSLFLELLHRELEEAARAKTGLWLLVVDLDHFAIVNEVFGHEVGEEALVHVGRLIEAAAGPDAIVGRTGDDEFALLIPSTPLIVIDIIAEQLLAAVQSPFAMDGESLVIDASMGIASYPDDGEDPDALLRSAEAALREAKASGPGLFRFPSPAITDEARRRTALRAELRHAVDAQQLVMHFQPQTEAVTGRIVGVEALVRWAHPERGLVPPGEFIGLAEESGDILPIGEWILRDTCRQMARWQEEGIGPAHTAVNISAAQLADTLFLDRVRHALIDARVAPELLELELTETAIMIDRDTALQTLTNLQDLGVQLSIDDFGMGYSSLSYLQRLPVEVLKIDLSFVHGMSSSSSDAEIVGAVIALGHSLGMRVVAEGVETEQQRELLVRMGCDLLQGYLISPPVPAEVMTALLREQRIPQP